MMSAIPDASLDAILAVQLTVAWAGEGRCSPRRLGWWDTDLIDESGGGDFMARLLPQTHRWASLEAVREAARRVDAKARGKMADPDKLRTIFFLGFAVDEQLGDRLAAHKRSGADPASVLSLPLPLGTAFAADALTATLHQGEIKFHTVPNGRQLKGKPPVEPDAMVTQLAAGLVPLGDHYPLPFFKVEA